VKNKVFLVIIYKLNKVINNKREQGVAEQVNKEEGETQDEILERLLPTIFFELYKDLFSK
jgi:hypothetical protein